MKVGQHSVCFRQLQHHHPIHQQYQQHHHLDHLHNDDGLRLDSVFDPRLYLDHPHPHHPHLVHHHHQNGMSKLGLLLVILYISFILLLILIIIITMGCFWSTPMSSYSLPYSSRFIITMIGQDSVCFWSSSASSWSSPTAPPLPSPPSPASLQSVQAWLSLGETLGVMLRESNLSSLTLATIKRC